MMKANSPTKAMLLMGLLMSSLLHSTVFAASSAGSASTYVAPSPTSSAVHWHAREGERFKRDWGIDIIGVHTVASGEMLAFRYRVLDADKAKVLNDKAQSAVLTDQKTGAKVTVPQMDKVGLLRTTANPKVNGVYWMIFPNTGRAIKPGSLVKISIGSFQVDSLVVN